MYRQASAPDHVRWLTVLLACLGVVTAIPAPNGSVDSFKVLPNLLKPQMIERLKSETNGFFKYACGNWCDSDVASLIQQVAKALELSPRQLGDLRLEQTALVDPFVHGSWNGAAIAYLTGPAERQVATWVNAEGSSAAANLGSLPGSVVFVPAGAKAILPSQVKMMVIPVLRQARPALDYYVGAGLWEALVSTHRAGRVLGLDFFRAHTRYPLFWHACFWSALGSVTLVLLSMPLIFRPLLRLAKAVERRMPGKATPAPRPRGPTLLENRRASLPKLPTKGNDLCQLSPSPCTPGTQHLRFMA